MGKITYTLLNWINGAPPAKSAANLNHMDKGIKDCADQLDAESEAGRTLVEALTVADQRDLLDVDSSAEVDGKFDDHLEAYTHENIASSDGKNAAESLAAHELAVELDKREICYGFGININDSGKVLGATYASTLFGCTSYIDCHKAKRIVITVPVRASAATQGIVFYDADKVAIAGSGILRPVGASDGSQTITIAATSIPATARYFRASYWNYPQMQALGVEFTVAIYYADDFSDGRNPKFRQYQSGMINFAVHVNQGISNFWDTAATNQEPESFKASTCALLLPTNYNPNGLPVKIIMCFGGASRAVWYQGIGDPDGVSTNNDLYVAQKERFRAAGYAILLCNGPRDNPTTAIPSGAAVPKVGCPQEVNAYYQAYQYVKEHYNVDSEIFVLGASAGGLSALNYCFTHQHVRALALLSSWVSIENNCWIYDSIGVREECVTYYGFAGTTDFEASKVAGYDPYARILDIAGTKYLPYHKHPIKRWQGSTEASNPLGVYGTAFIEALRNAKATASQRIIEGAGHEITYGGSALCDIEVLTWYGKQ